MLFNMSNAESSKLPEKRRRASSKTSSKRRAATAPFALNAALSSHIECLAENWKENKDCVIPTKNGVCIKK